MYLSAKPFIATRIVELSYLPSNGEVVAILLASRMVVAIQDASSSLSLDCGRRNIFGCVVLAGHIKCNHLHERWAVLELKTYIRAGDSGLYTLQIHSGQRKIQADPLIRAIDAPASSLADLDTKSRDIKSSSYDNPSNIL